MYLVEFMWCCPETYGGEGRTTQGYGPCRVIHNLVQGENQVS